MLSFFNHLNSLHPVSAEATAALLKVIRVKELRRGQVLLQEGAVCDKMHYVVKGLLKLYFETGSKELVMGFAKENEWMLAAESYFDGKDSIYTIRSVEPTIIISIGKNDLQYLMKQFSELTIAFSAIAALQISTLEQHTALLMLPAKDRFEKMFEARTWMTESKRITDKLLAAYLGVRANTVCEWRRGVLNNRL